MQYNPKKFTWGYEIEWGDVDRKTVIPEELGAWEFAETDILNIDPSSPYYRKAVDPLGLEPPVGGEINVKPTRTRSELVERVEILKRLFPNPTASCVNHGHVHVFVPGLRDDIDALKRLAKFIQENQNDAIDNCYGFRSDPRMRKTTSATVYCKYDGGRPMPDYMSNNIIKLAKNFDDFIFLHCAGKDGKSRGRPFRYAINTYCMKHTGTIEFRLFRGTTDIGRVSDSLYFAERFLNAALNDTGEKVRDILHLPDAFCTHARNERPEYDWTFPVFDYNHEDYLAWEATKYDKSRGKKVRQYVEL
jgi:hypothetical protein